MNEQLPFLVKLIDDPEQGVYLYVKGQIKHCGIEAISLIEDLMLENPENEVIQSRGMEIIQEIQFDSVLSQLVSYVQDPESDSFTGALLISKYLDSKLEDSEIFQSIEEIRKKAEPWLTPDLTDLEKIEILNEIFFEYYGFSSDIEEIGGIEMLSLDQVLKNRRGRPLSIGLIYQRLARLFNIPIVGTQLKSKMLLGLVDSDSDQILYYIDLLSNGRLAKGKDLREFMINSKKGICSEDLDPESKLQETQMFLLHAASFLHQEGDMKKLKQIDKLRIEMLAALGKEDLDFFKNL